MNIIESFENSKFKLAVSLKQNKFRKKHKKFLVEGLRNVELAISNDNIVSYIFIDELKIKESKYYKINDSLENKVHIISSKLMESLSDTITCQGIVAICNMKSYTIEDIELEDDILILDKIQDPGNLGTILRTADSSGIKNIICIKGTTDIYSQKVVRSSMGSLMYLKIIFIDDYLSLNFLKNNRYLLMASSLDEAIDYKIINTIKSKIALILGNEANGIDTKLLDKADLKVKIPIYGAAESLNVAIAGGILMYKLKERKLS